jgi:radical SAM-linked protein
VLQAFRLGQRLDGWTEWFDEGRWNAAFAEMERVHGVGLDWFVYRGRRLDEVLPWDRIDCGVTKAYLQKQLAAARNLAEVPDCVLAPCSVCGACDYDVVKNRVHLPEDYRRAPAPPPPPRETPVRTHVRIRYAKEGRLVALSHLEVMHSLLRAVRRANLPVAYSQGYHPKPKVSFGPALPVGVESTAEFLDLELVGVHEAGPVGAAFAAALPQGLKFLDAREIDARAPSLSESVQAVHYRVQFPDGWSAEALSRKIEDFHEADRSVVRRAAPPKAREKKRNQRFAAPKQREIDLKEMVTHLSGEGNGSVSFSLKAGPSGSAKPSEVLAAVFGDGTPPRGVKVSKEGVSFARPAGTPGGSQPRSPRYADA